MQDSWALSDTAGVAPPPLPTPLATVLALTPVLPPAAECGCRDDGAPGGLLLLAGAGLVSSSFPLLAPLPETTSSPPAPFAVPLAVAVAVAVVAAAAAAAAAAAVSSSSPPSQEQVRVRANTERNGESSQQGQSREEQRKICLSELHPRFHGQTTWTKYGMPFHRYTRLESIVMRARGGGIRMPYGPEREYSSAAQVGR